MALECSITFLGTVMRTPSRDEGPPKVRCWRASRPRHLCSQRSIVCGSSMHRSHEGSAVGSNTWTFTLISGVYFDCRRANRTAPVWFELALLSVLHEKFSCTCWVEDHGDRPDESKRDASEGQMSMVAAAAFAISPAASLPGIPLPPRTQKRLVGPFLFSRVLCVSLWMDLCRAYRHALSGIVCGCPV